MRKKKKENSTRCLPILTSLSFMEVGFYSIVRNANKIKKKKKKLKLVIFFLSSGIRRERRLLRVNVPPIQSWMDIGADSGGPVV